MYRKENSLLQQVPLFGTWFNALSGLSREAVIGIGSAAETLFRVMLKCVTGNLLDAFFMVIVAELLRGAFHPRSMRGSVLLVIVASALGALLLYMLHQIPSEKLKRWLQPVLSILILLLGVGVMLGGSRGGIGAATRFVFNIILETFAAVAGVGLLCTMFFSRLLLRPGACW